VAYLLKRILALTKDILLVLNISFHLLRIARYLFLSDREMEEFKDQMENMCHIHLLPDLIQHI
jgi:hypothetical protein